MPTSATRHVCRRAVASTFLGLLLVGTASTPALAESIREKQWHLDSMHAEEMWRTATGKGVTVAVIDSGVDAKNPDLRGQVLPGKDLVEGQPGDEHTDLDGHGTGMAGLIAGTGESGGGDGAFGLAPDAKILPIRVNGKEGLVSGAEGGERFVRVIPEAIRYAADSDAMVINISLGNRRTSPEMADAVRYALRKGKLIFAAAGNSGNKLNQVEYPAATPGVIGVGAVGKDLHKTAESEYGPQVDMAAPGEEMVSACGGKTGLCISHGTSAATALASASAALIWSAHPDWTNNQVLRVMLNTIGGPTDGAKRNDSIGYGIVRPRIALTSPGDPGPADKYPLPDFPVAASVPPTPGPSTGADSSDAQANRSQPADAASSSDDGGSSVLLLAIGAVSVVAAVVGVLVAVRRRRLV